MVEIAVAIPTFRRPAGLERLLAALARLETGAKVEILVADNDAERHEGFDLCQRFKAHYRWRLDAIVVPERGIAQARNALVEHLLAHSNAQFVAMLDDDEWPHPGWLEGFLRVQRETAADALHGAILREFETTPGAWAVRCQGIAPLRDSSGPKPMIEGTGNVMIARSCFEALEKPCFDPGFALTGGEDKDFFTRLRSLGKRFAWADEAVCHAFVPASRANFKWALLRAYRVGNSDMRVFLKYAPGFEALLREAVKIAGAIVLFPLLELLALPFPDLRAAPLCKLCRAFGKIAAVFGNHYNEYATVHGG
ncbi:MAG: glycosyltransferase family 2 protein [Rhizomicrobium sp.]